MTVRFMAMKIHYDHRRVLPTYLKYSTLPTREEYDEYLDLYKKEGIGGEGFHECLNFQIPENGNVRIYLPPTSHPSEKKMDDEFVIFSFTYGGDRDRPDHIVGVHANTELLDFEGINRPDVEQLDGVFPFIYHAEAPAEFVTLLNPSVEYDRNNGAYTPAYQKWGYGLRYITQQHAENIIRDSLQAARQRRPHANDVEQLAIDRQIEVLERISLRYFPGVLQDDRGNNPAGDNRVQIAPPLPPLPDKELGLLGERLVYQRERRYAERIGVDPANVEWISQVVPTSPYDIKTVRETPDGYRDHYLEVKSSRMGLGGNVYISANQVAFFEEHQENSIFVFVNFNEQNQAEEPFTDLSLDQLNEQFELIAVKYKLRRK